MTPGHLFHSLDIFAASGDQGDLTTAVTEAAHLVDCYKRQLSRNYSLFAGRAGLCYALLKLHGLTADPGYLGQAKELMTSGGEAFLSSRYVPDTLADGRAGVLWVLLQLYRSTGDAAIKSLIDAYGKKIIAGARSAPGGGLYWENPLHVNIQPLCSLAEGSAGIGLVFAQLARYSGDDLCSWVAKQAFTYVARRWDPYLAAWPDPRKGIRSGSDYKMHHEACLKGDIRFFQRPGEDMSILHGAAGILLCLVHSAGQPPHDPIIERTRQSHFGRAGDSLLPPNPGHHERIAAHILLDTMDTAPSRPSTGLHEYLDQPASPWISLSLPEARKEIVSGFFRRTIAVLEKTSPSQLCGHFQEPASGREDELYSFVSFMDQLLKDAGDQPFHPALPEIFQLEKWKLDSVRAEGSRPFRWIREMCDYDAAIGKLNQGNEWLLQQSLVIARDVVIRQTRWNWSRTYDAGGNARDLSTNLEASPSAYHLLFRQVAGEGLAETDMEAFGPILQCFSQGIKVETALQHITLFCQSQTQQALSSMIAQSNSRDKDDLLNRLPFLLLYQVKQLICDRVLDFVYS